MVALGPPVIAPPAIIHRLLLAFFPVRVAGVQGGDIDKHPVIFGGALEDPRPIVVIIPADGLAGAARVRDHEQKRVTAKLKTLFQHDDHDGGFMLMYLIDQRHMRPRPRLTVLIRADWPEKACR